MLRVAEVSAALGISRAVVARRVADGTIPSVRLGRRILIPRRWVDEMARYEGR